MGWEFFIHGLISPRLFSMQGECTVRNKLNATRGVLTCDHFRVRVVLGVRCACGVGRVIFNNSSLSSSLQSHTHTNRHPASRSLDAHRALAVSSLDAANQIKKPVVVEVKELLFVGDLGCRH